MPKSLTWDDAEDIGILLSEAHPELDPLAVRFTDLHRYVTELPGFAGDPKASNESKLEAMTCRRARAGCDSLPTSSCGRNPLFTKFLHGGDKWLGGALYSDCN